jgi:hypothetical protein
MSDGFLGPSSLTSSPFAKAITNELTEVAYSVSYLTSDETILVPVIRIGASLLTLTALTAGVCDSRSP